MTVCQDRLGTSTRDAFEIKKTMAFCVLQVIYDWLAPGWGWGNPGTITAKGFPVVSTLGLYISSDQVGATLLICLVLSCLVLSCLVLSWIGLDWIGLLCMQAWTSRPSEALPHRSVYINMLLLCTRPDFSCLEPVLAKYPLSIC